MQNDADTLFNQYAQQLVDMDEKWLSVEQQGVNENQAAEMAQVRQTITNEMWENYRRRTKGETPNRQRFLENS
ncbi:hypothetical protein JHK86_031952 [Glycine max]|nr:hypothetical protein JHK86_031952 [Glycine max]